MRTQEPRSSKPGESIIPVSCRRMLVLILLIATVSVIAAGIFRDYHPYKPHPDPSPAVSFISG